MIIAVAVIVGTVRKLWNPSRETCSDKCVFSSRSGSRLVVFRRRRLSSRHGGGSRDRGWDRGRSRVVSEVQRQVYFERRFAAVSSRRCSLLIGRLLWPAELQDRRVRGPQRRHDHELAARQYFERRYRIDRGELRDELACRQFKRM